MTLKHIEIALSEIYEDVEFMNYRSLLGLSLNGSISLDSQLFSIPLGFIRLAMCCLQIIHDQRSK